ncbi:FAD-dependent oxidoreductase [Sphingomonas sp. NSE70-1]|uniref:FAD-dependent oxidoreductase n=1 Tax=Sphingomonas caseinilyticus TaxID=2908205 RepID=A0ABT0RSG8_9SPHN|nr:FAD-dependent oxidoreductase [Sphingomonas caseinilyticus]MCL6697957.1 FAD-dependent oxidoreductase [Sphingomonas caseinilyticus]
MTRRSLIGGMTAGALAPAVLRAAKPGSAAHVAVIGAGVFGSWTAEHLRRAGHRVTLVDMAGPAQSRASSGGESRMTRGGYGKDEIYTRMAFESLPEWKKLSESSGLPIFIQSGVLFFSSKPGEYFDGSIEVHRRLGLPLEQLDGPQLQRRFPMIDFSGVIIGLYEPEFGALMARRSVQTLVKNFVATGGEYRLASAQAPRADSGQLSSIQTSDGPIEADAFIFALGPWLPKLFPDILGKKIFATRQEIFYFAPPKADRRFQPEAMPGWADFNDGDMFYGFPNLESRGVKFAHDQHGAYVDPDTQSREPTKAALDDVIEFRDRRFPLLKGAPVLGAEVCQYENSSNGDFLIDRHPALSNVVLVGGGSGHGFKHGPEVGRLAASLITTGGGQPEPRFTLATKGETQHREVH